MDQSLFSIPLPFISAGADVTHLVFDPLLPLSWLTALALVFVVLFVVASKQSLKTFWVRLPAFLLFIFVLLNPVTVTETRQSSANIVLVVTDQTESQSLGKRTSQTSDALRQIEDMIAKNERLRLQTVSVTHNLGIDNPDVVYQTDLYTTLQKTLMTIDLSRLGAVIVITDGQIHDLPLDQNQQLSDFSYAADLELPENVPIHTLITGSEAERDRQILIESAPYYGIAGQDAEIQIKVLSRTGEPISMSPEEFINVQLHINGERSDTRNVRAGDSVVFNVPIAQVGSNIYRFSIPVMEGELSVKNNQKVATINGVRDRLQVLLISGKPNHGGRMWRDILRSDAGVDLVHFTILREPGKIDTTPKEEMSLIEFPIRELFEEKIDNFDLIILDRYGLTYLLPDRYFENMYRFVEQGGGLLVTIGPEALNDYSIFDTILGEALPAELTGRVAETEFHPALTSLGRRHPVTAPLNEFIDRDKTNVNTDRHFTLDTAPWLRQIDIQPKADTQTVLSGVNDNALMVLNRYQDGRVALLGSDQLWLWARGYAQAGPNRLLLKRMIHWLMKEPELDETGLIVSVKDREITVMKRALDESAQIIEMTTPTGEVQQLALTPENGRAAQVILNAEESGIYQFSSQDGQTQFVMVGNLDDPEQIDLLSTSEKLSPIVNETGGYIGRIGGRPVPAIRLLGAGLDMASSSQDGSLFTASASSWMGVLDRQAYVIEGIRKTPLIPINIGFLVVFIAVIATWLWESRLFGKRRT